MDGKDLGIIPQANTLDVFLTNVCNMACKDCCVAVTRGSGEAATLSWETLSAALDYFQDRVLALGDKTVLFAGGEPLSAYRLLRRGVERLRARAAAGSPAVLVQVYTNGTLLTRARLDELRGLGATVIVSLDGVGGRNDRYRRFAGGRGSVFDRVMDRLRPQEPGALAGTEVNIVIHSGNLDHLLDDIEAFRRMGFPAIDLWIDYFELWDDRSLARLARFFSALRDYYVKRAGAQLPFVIPMLRHVLHNARELSSGRAWWRECTRLVLGPDGHFYDCEGCMAFPLPAVSGHRIGDPFAGVDWRSRRAYLDAAGAWLESRGAAAGWHHVCPRVYYRVATQKGEDPGPLLDNLHSVSRVFCDGLLLLAGSLGSQPAFRRAYG